MLDARLVDSIGKIISLGTILTCVLVTPQLALDPINLPKMVVLAITAGVALGMLFSVRSSITKNGSKAMLYLFFGFQATLFVSVVFSRQNLAQGIFGTHGRNTGLVTYFSFMILLFVAFHISNQKELKRFVKTLYIAGLLSTAYGLIQFLGFDPAGWDIYASPIVGFLGNSDFQSAFLAIFATVAFSQGVLSAGNRWPNFAIATFAMLITFLTQAKQGLVAFILGASIVILVIAIKKNWKVVTGLYLVGAASGITLIALGLRDFGPVGHIIYKSSLEARFYYWQAAIRAFKDNFLFGVGLDAFGDYYGRYRTVEAVAWNTQPTNAAHNIYLDYAANGGIFFLVLNLILVGWVIKSFILVVVRDRNFNSEFIALFSGWVAFQAQSLISINQIGLAVWNWVISGLLIGYASNSKVVEAKTPFHQKSSKRLRVHKEAQQSQLKSGALVGGFVGFVFMAIVVIPTYIGSVQYWNAMTSGDLKRVGSAAYIWPQDEYKYWSVLLTIGGNAGVIDENSPNPNPVEIQKQIDDIYRQALAINRDAVIDFPNSMHLWRLYAKNPLNVKSEIDLAMRKIKELDPNNPVL
jgi:O-antigen ligase